MEYNEFILIKTNTIKWLMISGVKNDFYIPNILNSANAFDIQEWCDGQDCFTRFYIEIFYI